MSEDPRGHHPEDRRVESGSEIERTVFFSDAVFAIALTLLALEIRPPAVPDDSAELRRALLGLWPHFFSFLLSFWVVGTYWMGHHRVFRYVRGYDRRLLSINLLFLMWVVLLPFSSSLLGGYTDQRIVAIIYATHIVLVGLSLYWV